MVVPGVRSAHIFMHALATRATDGATSSSGALGGVAEAIIGQTGRAHQFEFSPDIDYISTVRRGLMSSALAWQQVQLY